MRFLLLIVSVVIASASFAAAPKALSASELLEASKSADWRTPDPAHLLHLKLATGTVIIELAPDYAPRHVARIQDLARQKYWDGLAVVRVQDNYVAQWADPNSENEELKKKFKGSEEVLPGELDVETPKKIEFTKLQDKDAYADETGFTKGMAAGRDRKMKKTWLLHCYGAIGVGRDVAPESGDGTQLYAVIGHAPRHLDRNVTVVGKILQGAEFLSSLPRGHGPLGFYDKDKKEQPVAISSVRLASEMPEKERVSLEVLRTDTPLFTKWVQAKRSRTEEWFHYPAGRIEACNLTIPVREKKK